MITQSHYDDLKKRTNRAFRALRQKGYRALQNFKSHRHDALDEVCEEEAYVFYTKPGGRSLRQNGDAYLLWRGEGEEIAAIFRSNGLEVLWDGDTDKCMKIRLPKKERGFYERQKGAARDYSNMVYGGK